ncbi:muscular LMNA-interacting protein [Oryzias melastigma]|uniref:muscular LMNA-interacting protein n=1 Tax=Oryzias melastigma TaxID=30732 RepID=UPI00168CB432|nr:muscular LMNA-interacting protein [Oryzias melastigma]
MSARKVAAGNPDKSTTFTFVPEVHRLPAQVIFTAEDASKALAVKSDKNPVGSHERNMWETMPEREIFKAERVVIKDSVEEGARHIIQLDTQPRLKSSPGHKIFSQIKASPPVSSWSENTSNHVASDVVSMETGVDKHKDVHRAQVSSGCSENRASEDRVSPTNSADLFPTPTSSRESILSECWDKEKSWFQPSSATSPYSFSRTVSPCSSVRSGAFTPSVIQIKKHFLAPGSSLVNIPQTCFSSCDSLSSSVCAQTPPLRHRPPLTRLSLLTAILRKGRLPVLSTAQERPYTPCWPVNLVSLSFCNACSAASSVASIPLQLSSQFSSSTSIDSQNQIHSKNCVTASDRRWPKMERRSEQICPSSELRREQVIPLPPVRNGTFPRTPLPLLSNFNSASPPKHDNSDFVASAYSSFSKHSNPHADPKPKELISTPSKLYNEEIKRTPQSQSSLSKLRLLSQRLKSPPVSPHPPNSIPASPTPPLQNTTHTSSVGACESDQRFPAVRSITPSQAFRKAHCLPPSRYATVALPGWQSPISPSTPTPSLAPPVRNLTTSPSLSLRSTPSPRPGSGISDCSDGEGKKRKTLKIKSSYKSLAAIPTNNLLLDQQAIDEQVEKNQSRLLDRAVTDTHAEMCSPAQLRQQSEELYAVIDEILADSSPVISKTSKTNAGIQHKTQSFQKSLGRETKYASVCSLYPSTDKSRTLVNSKKTKPGIVRPMTAIPRLSVKDEDVSHSRPFRKLFTETSPIKKKEGKPSFNEAKTNFYNGSNGKLLMEKRWPEKSQFSVCELHIKEPDEISHPRKGTSAPFSRMEELQIRV